MIIAYASSNTDPINHPTDDPQIDLYTGASSYTVNIYGNAADSANPSATFTWAWSLLNTPTGVSINDATAQNIEVTLNNDWRNVRVHLVATNTATGESSESNILLAPTSSFCEIRVLSAERGLQKPAVGTRDWQGTLETWADKIEDSAPANVALTDLSDVSNATGAQLDILVSGNDAVDTGGALHTHLGTHVDLATNTVQGTVVLESAVPAGTTPKVLVQERLIYSQASDFSLDKTFSGSMSEKIIFHSTSTSLLRPHVVFRADEDIEITHVSIVLLDAGTSGASYVFQLCLGTDTKVMGSIMIPDGATLSGTPQANYYPMVIDHEYTSSISIPAGGYFGLAVIDSPLEVDAGRSLRVTFRAVRELN